MTDSNKKSIRTIGVLIDTIGNAYTYQIMNGIQESVDRYGLNIIYFSDIKVCELSGDGSITGIILKLVQPETFDALLLFPGIFDSATKEQTREFLQQLKPFPFLIISHEYDGYPHIHVDNKIGFRKLISHIIEQHGKKKLAFIKGTKGTFDSEERFSVYREVLSAHGLPLRDEIIVDGNYMLEAGREAVRLLVSERQLKPGTDFDAIIAVNDTTAIGAIEMLTAYGYKVPETVAVTGFDDWHLGQTIEAPLSTVRQCVEKIGSEAVRLIYEQTNDLRNTELPTQMVIRQSCGCNMKTEIFSGEPGRQLSYKEAEEIHTLQKNELAGGMEETILFSSVREEIARAVIRRFIDSFPLIFADYTGETFINEFSRIISTVHLNHTYLELFARAFIILREWLIKILDIPALTFRLKSIIDQITVMLRTKLEKTEFQTYIEFEYYVNDLRFLADSIAQNLRMDQFLERIWESLNRLGFRHFYFFLYNIPGEYSSGYRLILSNSNGRKYTPGSETSLYPDFHAIRESILSPLSPFSVCLLPVAYQESRFGFLILNRVENPYSYITYETITSQINSTLKNITLMSELLKAYRRQEESSLELQAAYDKLKTTQRSLFQSEKMAAIGQLAGGVAHEINNPMGVILGFSQSIMKRIKKDDPLFMPLESIEREAMRCKKLVGDLLTFSRTGKTQSEEADINETIDSALSIIAAQARTANIEIEKSLGGNIPRILLYKNQIQQVIVNLCNNAMDAIRGNQMQEKKSALSPGRADDGKISVSTEFADDHILIRISDTGTGMTEDVKKHLFEPFFTTKEVGKGTGLGLSICYEIVKRHNGNIEVESETGKGTTFFISLPAGRKEKE